MMPLPCSTTPQLSCSRTGGVNTGWKWKIYAPVIQIQCSHGAVSSFFPLKTIMKPSFFGMLRFFLCVCIIAVIAIIATKFHQVLRCKQSEVDLVMKAAKTRRKNPCGVPRHQVLLRKHHGVFFHQMLFSRNLKKVRVHHNLGVFFISLPSPLGLCLRLTHWEAAETFSDLLMQLPPGRLRCSALLNRAPLGRISWELRFSGENRGRKDL